jgi:acyl carrier protein
MSTAVTTEQVEKVVSESLATFGADPDQITPDATFEALDIDSLDLAELSQIVHERFGVELKGSDVAEVKTVDDAVQLIASRL